MAAPILRLRHGNGAEPLWSFGEKQTGSHGAESILRHGACRLFLSPTDGLMGPAPAGRQQKSAAHEKNGIEDGLQEPHPDGEQTAMLAG